MLFGQDGQGKDMIAFPLYSCAMHWILSAPDALQSPIHRYHCYPDDHVSGQLVLYTLVSAGHSEALYSQLTISLFPDFYVVLISCSLSCKTKYSLVVHLYM